MNRIRLLHETVANQIAAGEVVERPASVVKELVENAIDAQARRLIVEIEAGGRSLIRITDDGWGMSRDDALLCLERHATSKIQTADDLRTISTLGFRGEAVPSIASVSRFTLTTRERETATEVATRIILHGGRIISVQEAGAPCGTCIEVRQLFFNLPARRKFMRSEQTERAHIQHYLSLVSLAYPEIALTFINDHRPVWQLPALNAANESDRIRALRERLVLLHGADEPVLDVDFTGDTGNLADLDTGAVDPGVPLRLWGVIGAPGVSRATRENQYLFVNRRPVDNRGLNYALLEGYHTALMKGRYPVACLFLELDPAEVDVNIHPAKREVKFRRENRVRFQVVEAIRQILSAPLIRTTPSGPMPAQRPSLGMPPSPAASKETSPNAAAAPAASSMVDTQALPGFSSAAAATGVPAFNPPSSSQTTAVSMVPTPVHTLTSTAHSASPSPPGVPILPSTVTVFNIPLRMIGVLGRLYVLFESDRGLVLLDQHAAHERVLFEQMLKQLEKGVAPSQRLLLAQTIELPPRDAQFLRDNLGVLAKLGVGLSEFGERTFLLDALPPYVKGASPRDFLLEVLAELKAAGEGVNPLRLGESLVATTVCRHAVKAHDPLSPPEIDKLLEQLRGCQMPYTCPHGRPTLIEINYRELEKKFGRIQA